MQRPVFYLTAKRQSYKALVRELRKMGLSTTSAKRVACSALNSYYMLEVEFAGQILKIRNTFNR